MEANRGTEGDPPRLPLPRRLHREHDPERRVLPEQNKDTRGEATPFSVVKAQDIIRRLLPFAEHEVAAQLAEAHAHLEQWTQALWGHSIQLVDSHENMEASREDMFATQMETNTGEEPSVSQMETVPFHAMSPEEAPRRRMLERASSHRRRRLQAALEGTSESESEKS